MEQADILVVDDDYSLRRQLTRYLSKEGYKVVEADSGKTMRQALDQYQPNLVLLDLRLPDTHGLELAREVRADPDIGIIILTGSQDEIDKIVGLELGADDYLNKPVDLRELLARIRSVMRRVDLKSLTSTRNTNKVASFAGYSLDFTAHLLLNCNAEEIKLTSHEYQLLVVLLENVNRVLSRDQLMAHISGRDWLASDRSIDILIGKVRKKIEKDSSNPVLIKTVRGTGYIFTSPVEITNG